MKRILLLLFLPFLSWAQTVTINKVELAGSKIIVHYKLESPNQANQFMLNLYESKDNFSTPLAKVTGDVGAEVKVGNNNKIEWNIREEYGNYKGNVALELRGRVYVPFVKLQNFNVASSYKRGKSYDVLWKAGSSDLINIELFKGDKRIQGGMSHPNNGAFSLTIPSDAQSGSDYKLKISSTKNNEEVIYSSAFKVTPKIPFLLKVLVPVVVVGGIAAATLGGGSKDTGGGTTKGDLPFPNFPGN